MKKSILLILFAVLYTLIVACGGTAAESVEPTAQPDEAITDNALTTVEESTDSGTARPTVTSPPLPEITAEAEDYPAAPVGTAVPEGYSTTTLPTRDPYPGGEEPDANAESGLEEAPVEEVVIDIEFATLRNGTETAWVVVSAGVQCEPEEKLFADINEAGDALIEADVAVYDAVVESRMVCAACGCPESAHYRLEIDAEAVETAVDLGFVEDVEQ